MDRLRRDGGFTLIEVLVVLVIIGLLAAAALPIFLGQRAKAQDSSAKSDARSMVSQVESCYTEQDRYDGCPFSETGLELGSGQGEVEVTPSGDIYVVVARSVTGNSFTVTKNTDGTSSRSCSDAGTAAGGCRGGSW